MINAIAIPGLLIMPDKYRRLMIDRNTVSQVGCSAIEWNDLFKELDSSDLLDWIKENVIQYKISIMLMDAGYQL